MPKSKKQNWKMQHFRLSNFLFKLSRTRKGKEKMNKKSLAFRTKGKGKKRVVYPLIASTGKPRRTIASVLEIQRRRSRKAKIADAALKAPIAESPEQWASTPNRLDLPNVDTPKKPQKTSRLGGRGRTSSSRVVNEWLYERLKEGTLMLAVHQIQKKGEYKGVVNELGGRKVTGAVRRKTLEKAMEKEGLTKEETTKIISEYLREGDLYEPREGLLKATELEPTKSGVASYNEATGWMRINFDDIPSKETRDEMKAHGFRYKPYSKAWSAKWTPEREDLAKKLVGKMETVNIKPNWAAKAERAAQLSQKHEQLSSESFDKADKLQSVIPFGQPILVGHHSEKRHRSDLRKIDKSHKKGIEESEIAEKYARRALRFGQKATGENPVLIFNRIQKLEAQERDFKRRLSTNPNSEHSKKWLKHTQTRLKIEREKYKASGGIATEKGSYKPGDRIQTRYGTATIKTISKKSARVAFDDPRTSIYGLPTDSLIKITTITGKLPADKKYVFTKIKKQPELNKFVGEKVTISGEQHRQHGCDIYGDTRFSKRGKLVKEGSKLYFVEKGAQTKEPVTVGKMNYGIREKITSPLHIREIRSTWGKEN